MSKKVYIRADGNSFIGLGHLVRCISLAHIIRNEFGIIFACKTIPDTLRDEIITSGFEIRMLSSESDLLELLSSRDIVVVDSYDLDTEYQKKIKQTEATLVCIDDLHDKEFVADLIINHAPGIKQEDYNAQPYTRFALGIQFALLRPAFLDQAKEIRSFRKIETVLVCFGGSDQSNLTEKIARMLLNDAGLKTIIIITGAAYTHTDSIAALENADKRIKYHHAVDADKMLTLMLQAELAIVPSSSISIEAYAAGMRIITGTTVDNQQLIYKGLLELDIAEGIGDFNMLAPQTLSAALTKIKQQPFQPKAPEIHPESLLHLFKSLSINDQNQS